MYNAGSPPGTAPTVGQLFADLGPLLDDVVLASAEIEARVAAVAFHDPHQHRSDSPGAQMLLAVGPATDAPELAALVRAAADAGVVAIACRAGSGWDDDAVRTAAARSVSLVSIRPEVGWGELYELIRTTIEVGEAETELGPVAPEWSGADDLTAVCEALAAVTGGLVGIDDMQGRIVAFSSSEESDPMRTASILNHRVPDGWLRQIRRAGVMDQLLSSDDVIRVSFDDLEPRRAIAIRLGRSVLGSIWLIGDDERIAADADEALRRAAPIAALQMMRQRLVVDAERRMREASLASLLRGGPSPPQALSELGIADEEPLVVVAVDVLARGTSSPTALGQRLGDMLTMHLQAYQLRAAATSLEVGRELSGLPRERIYVLAGVRGGERGEVRRIVREYVAQASRTLGARLRAGIGQEVASVEELPRARRGAEDCLAAAPRFGPVVGFEEVYDQALTADVDEFVAAWRGGTSDAYQALLSHDEAHGTEYRQTLRCLLDAFGSTTIAAERLHLHVNTVRYRLRRITEITGVDLHDGNARLALELNLRALDAGAGREA